MNKVEGGVKVLYDYIQTLVDDGLLQEGSVTDYDCQWLWEKAMREEQEVREREFAI